MISSKTIVLTRSDLVKIWDLKILKRVQDDIDIKKPPSS